MKVVAGCCVAGCVKPLRVQQRRELHALGRAACAHLLKPPACRPCLCPASASVCLGVSCVHASVRGGRRALAWRGAAAGGRVAEQRLCTPAVRKGAGGGGRRRCQCDAP